MPIFAHRGKGGEKDEIGDIQEQRDEIKGRLIELIELDAQKYFPCRHSISLDYLKHKLKIVYLNKSKEVFDFIEKNLAL